MSEEKVYIRCPYCHCDKNEKKFKYNICGRCWIDWSGLFPDYMKKYNCAENELQYHIKEIQTYHKRRLALSNYRLNKKYYDLKKSNTNI